MLSAVLAALALSISTPTHLPPRCPVAAAYSPVRYNYLFLPDGMPAVMSASIGLRAGCAKGGLAVVWFESKGRLIPEDGPYILTPDHPSITVSGVPGYWQPMVQAPSGALSRIPWHSGAAP